MEKLGVKDMMKQKKLSRQISDASWGLLTQILEYKCKWYGRELIKINQYYHSSKMCSGCGNVKDILLLSERIYGDLLASNNILTEGIRLYRTKCKTDIISAI